MSFNSSLEAVIVELNSNMNWHDEVICTFLEDIPILQVGMDGREGTEPEVERLRPGRGVLHQSR